MDEKNWVLTAKKENGRWKYGVPRILKGGDFWTWSIKTYSTRAAAIRAGRGYFPASAQGRIRVVG